jgi:hypothetical protein
VLTGALLPHSGGVPARAGMGSLRSPLMFSVVFFEEKTVS